MYHWPKLQIDAKNGSIDDQEEVKLLGSKPFNKTG